MGIAEYFGLLSFEVIGTPELIVIQLACLGSDADQLREQIISHFPEARVIAVPSFLLRTWIKDRRVPSIVVDFGLASEFMLPLKSLPTAMDPLVTITGALGKLREEEVGLIQVLFEPVRNPWTESVISAVTDHEGKDFFANAPDLVKHARQKIQSPLFAVVIRVAAKSADEDRMWQIAKSIGAGLAHLTNPNINALVPLSNEGYDDLHHEIDLVARLSHRSGMLLNIEELISLVHLPTGAVRAPKLKRQSGKTKAAPSLALNHELLLGVNEHEEEVQRVTLSVDQRVKHTYVIGASGTGKSTFLLNCIMQDIERGEGLAVLDPHGDLIDQVMERIPENRWDDVILFDPSDEDFPIGFNILSAHSEIEKQLLASDLVAVFKRLSTAWGDQMNSVLGNAILSFLESERGGTLADMRRFLVEKEYREEFLTTVKDRENIYYWQKEFPILTGRPQGPLLTRLDTFLRPKLVRFMVAQKENRLDFAEIMNGRKIFLAKLAQGGIGEENSFLLGSLIVSKFHQLALARQEMRAADRRPFYLYIDEFHNFVTPSMASILSGARKYRLGLVLAHQELRQVKNEEVAGAIIANPYTRVCFRLGDQDARKLEDGFSFFDAKDLQNLGIGEAICRIERAEFDFNLQTPPIDQVGERAGRDRVDQITRLSQKRYGTPRQQVEEALEKAFGRPSTASKPEKPQATESVTPSEPVAEPVQAKSPPQPAAAPPIETVPQQAPATEVQTSSDPPKDISPEPPQKAKTKAKPVEEMTLGRGGSEHKYLQELIKQWAEGLGWKASIEMPVPGAMGSVDVGLEKQGRIIACEICVTSPVEQEISNIEKCVKSGLENIVSVSLDKRQLAKIETAAKKRFTPDELARVRFLIPEDLFEFVEEIDAKLAKRESTVKGYQVTTSYRAPAPGEKAGKKKIISGVIMKSLDELRKKVEQEKKRKK